MRAFWAAVSIAIAVHLNASEFQVLQGHIPAAAANLNALGRLPGSTRVELTMGLGLRNHAELERLLHEIYDPASPRYKSFLTVGQFTEAFGPREQDYEALLAFVRRSGFAIKGTHPNRTLLDVSAAVADLEKAFHIKMLVYKHPSEPRDFYAPDKEPSLDLSVPVLRILGLDDYIQPRPASLKAGRAGGRESGIANAGSGPGGSFQGNDFRQAYVPDVSLSGAGQVVGLLELDGYYGSDITAYEDRAGLSHVPLTNVLLNGFLGTPGPNNFEVALDIELTIAMAPGLSQVIVYEAGPQGVADSVLNRMATDNLAKQLSSSWLWSSGQDAIADQIFQQFAAQGQSFFTAAGDVDAYTGAVPFPADNPYVTVVGATTLSTATGGGWASESALNLNNGQGGSGGISTTYAIPFWQQTLNMATNQGSATQRNLPDVAMVGNNVSIIYNNGQTNSFYGTSCSAPLWAGFVALVNQQAANYGQPTIGFINPAIYSLGQGSNYPVCFHDITIGNNTNSGSPTRFFACPGYDLCTGWGSPAGQALINALGPPTYLVVSPNSGLSATAWPGGPFSPSAQTFFLSNSGPTTLTWSLSNPSAWLSITPTSGTIPAGGPAVPVTVRFSAAANSLPGGDYSATLTFTDVNPSLTQFRTFTLHVSQSVMQNGGFETGDFSSWVFTGNPLANRVAGAPIGPHSGQYAAEFGQVGSLAYVSQTVPTCPGQSYILSFWLANPSGAIPNQFVLNWNTNQSSTNTLLNLTNMGAFAWSNFQFAVTATESSSVLQLGFRDDPQYLGLDDVSLVLDLVSSAADGIPDWWAIAHGLNPKDSSVASQDPDGDGLSNLMEYAVGTDPLNPADAQEGISFGFAGAGDASYLTMTFRRRKADPGLEYIAEVSSDQQTWFSDSGHLLQVSVTPVDCQFDSVMVQDLTGTTAPASRFMRLRVTAPPLQPALP